MLKLENISTGYGKKQVLFDVSFEVNKGDVVLLAGSNGSGKSTLLKVIYGILPLWNSAHVNGKGRIYFDGENITSNSTSRLLKKGLLYIPQKNNLFEELTVKENLEVAGLTLGSSKLVQQRIEHALSLFNFLTPSMNKTPMKLSGGERKLLMLAMAILHQPKMILLDEPFSGLTQYNITFIRDILSVLNKRDGVTMLIVEHRVKESIAFTNSVIGLINGHIVRNPNQSQILNSELFELIFN